MRIKRLALKPSWTVTLYNNNEPLTGLDGDGVRVTFIGTQGAETLFADMSPVIDAEAGTVTHDWTDLETAVSGQVYGNVDVDYGDGRTIRFPPYGQFVCHIEETPATSFAIL